MGRLFDHAPDVAVVIPLKLVYTPVDATVTAIRNYQVPVEGQPWVPDGSTVGPRFLGGNRGFPHKNRQPWVPATSVLFCVRWATRPNCQPLTLSHLEFDGGPTVSMPAATPWGSVVLVKL